MILSQGTVEINKSPNRSSRERQVRAVDDKERQTVIGALVNFIERVANEKRPSKAEVAVLPEVVRALNEFTRFTR